MSQPTVSQTVLAQGTLATEELTNLTVGQLAPQFSLPNQDGKTINLSDFLGKYVCVYFYPKDFTPGCTAEGCLFRDFNEELKALNCVVLGISADTVESHQKFRERKMFSFDLLSDPDHLVLRKYDAWQQKSIFGKKFWGIQRSTVLIDPEGKVVAIWPKADPNRNPQQVLDFLTK